MPASTPAARVVQAGLNTRMGDSRPAKMVEDRSRGSGGSTAPSAAASGASPAPQAGKKGGVGTPGVVPASYLEPGARLEARDPVNDQWFPVKVTDEDKEAKEVHSTNQFTTCGAHSYILFTIASGTFKAFNLVLGSGKVMTRYICPVSKRAHSH